MAATTAMRCKSIFDATTEGGVILQTLCDTRPVLLVFLRHWGCSFCRETLSDLANLRPALEANGTGLVFVHMGSPERAKPYFDYYLLPDVQRISDPDQELYRDPAFALTFKAVWKHVFDPGAIKRFFGGITLRHGIDLIFREDETQMPGVFLLYRGQILRSYRYKSIADKPDFLKLTQGIVALKQ